MATGPEFELVEAPLINQLISMGWKYTAGNIHDPSVTGRESFREVFLLDDLRAALRRVNVEDDGRCWLEDAGVEAVISALTRVSARDLMAANQHATELLLKGVPVEPGAGASGERARTARFFDWERAENNTFRVINQFKVQEPGGLAHRAIIPDLVLFINGIPLVVIEAKAPHIPSPMEQGIEQLQRYANQRHWVDAQEGNERLFYTNQLLISTHFDVARLGTIGASAHHFLEWKDTSPVSPEEVRRALGKDSLSSQEILVAGTLHPETLLDIVRHFTLFMVVEDKTIKAVCRYQQLRAVHRSIARLKQGKTRAQDGQQDRRGGIIWHTQGSGKSLTMVFLIRKMRTDPDLRRFKVVVVTDRKDLQRQLSDTATLTGDIVEVPGGIAELHQSLRARGPALVFAMIQHYREDAAADVLNDDEGVVLLVDEAHRSHTSASHAQMKQALPNAASIGFTGTPIIMGQKKRTTAIFGDLIDQYTLRESEADGATLPILYEGRTSSGAVADGRELDDLFEDMLHGWTPAELERIKARYATRGDVMEATKLIEAKARDMLRHYVQNILPNGLKAQVVAVSRLAATRYHAAFLQAKADLIRDLEALPSDLVGLADDQMEHLPERRRVLVRARRVLEPLRALDFAVVISGEHNDAVDPDARWSAAAVVKANIAAFKKPFPAPGDDDPARTSPLGILIVKSMLLTGFDAPIEQALYLDRAIREAELLQAIARVNRPYARKPAGLVVDYYGVAQHLQEALAAYDAADIDGALSNLRDELPRLRERHFLAVDLFQGRGLSLDDDEACVALLSDLRLRAQLQVRLKDFLKTLELVLPRPEALPYLRDARALGAIQLRARNRYRGSERPIGEEVGAKVRALIDEHVISLGIDPKIAPMAITHPHFDQHAAAQRSPRARASEMEHALRHHVSQHMAEDPERFEALSLRLDRILTQMKEDWSKLIDALQSLKDDIIAGRQRDNTGLDPETHAPFFGVLRQELTRHGDPSAEQLHALVEVTAALVPLIQRELRLEGFWDRTQAQQDLRALFVQRLDDRDLFPYARLPEVADRLLELARANHVRLTR